MAKHLLTDARVRKAKARPKAYRLFDGEGLALWVAPSGVKSWQLRYRLHGKPQTLTIGKYGTFSLAEARERAETARLRAADGVHLPVDKRVQRLRKQAETATLFEGFAMRWIAHEARRLRWSADYRLEVERSIARHLKTLHPLPVVEITAPVAAAVLRDVEHATPMMAEKVRRRLRGILDFAVEEGLIPGNPLPARRRGPKVERKHFPAVTDRAGVGEILRKARASDPAKGIARAHLLTAFTAQRIAEVVGAQWSEFDLEAGLWSIPRSRMKIATRRAERTRCRSRVISWRS